MQFERTVVLMHSSNFSIDLKPSTLINVNRNYKNPLIKKAATIIDEL